MKSIIIIRAPALRGAAGILGPGPLTFGKTDGVMLRKTDAFLADIEKVRSAMLPKGDTVTFTPK